MRHFQYGQARCNHIPARSATTTEPAKPATATALAVETVVVPDVLAVAKSYKPEYAYEDNPGAAIAEYEGHLKEIILRVRLEPDIQLQSVEEPSSQVPAPGTRVPARDYRDRQGSGSETTDW